MQKLSRTGAYAGWGFVIALVGFVGITLVHDVEADHHYPTAILQGDGESAHWEAVNKHRTEVNKIMIKVVSDTSRKKKGELKRLQEAWEAYKGALREAVKAEEESGPPSSGGCEEALVKIQQIIDAEELAGGASESP